MPHTAKKALFNLDTFFGTAHTQNRDFGKMIQNYGVHFQMGVPAEASAANWEQEEVWNPSKDENGDYPSIVHGSQPIETGDHYLKFDSNLNINRVNHSTQIGYIELIIDYMKSIPELTTPSANTYNLGLALYGLQLEKTIGCKPGESHSSKPNCLVPIPQGIPDGTQESEQIWATTSNYTLSE